MNKLYTLLLTALILFFAYGIITKEKDTSLKKEKRVECQKKTITFEKIANKNLAKDAIKALETDNYIIKSRIEQSVYMKSSILNYITKEKSDVLLKSTISKYIKDKKVAEKKLTIDYYILENDKEDKGKKGPKAKLYAGYLVFEFLYDGKLIYKIQTDYMKSDTSDIPERMDCVIKSFISLKKEN